MTAKFKWFEFGTSETGPMYMICADTVDVGRLLHLVTVGGLSEEELGEIVIAQAQNAEWAERIVAALNAVPDEAVIGVREAPYPDPNGTWIMRACRKHLSRVDVSTIRLEHITADGYLAGDCDMCKAGVP